MGKISGLPDAERFAIIGYLAQEGVIKEITAEVPIRRSDDFQTKYGVKPYIIRSDKKYSDQLRIYLNDPDDAPPLLRDALDSKYQRLNDSEFVRELVDNYGFTFFSKQNSRVILEYAKKLLPHKYDAFLSGYNTNEDLILAIQNSIQAGAVPTPTVCAPEDVSGPSTKKKGKKNPIVDSNASLSEEQLLLLGWAGEEYLYNYLSSGEKAAFAPFSIDPSEVIDIVWYNAGYTEDKNWVDGSVGKGCDILVKAQSGDYLIEVKSSKRKSPIFGMTSYEMQKMKEQRLRYYLAKLDYLENLTIGKSPLLKVFKDPYDRFFSPERMQKAIFFCE